MAQHDQHEHRTVLVVAGGDEPAGAHLTAALGALPDDALVVAADSGVAHAVALDLVVHHLVGDLDSADGELVDEVARAGAVVTRHPAAKDATDLELALDTASDLGAHRLLVIGGHGGRVDHFLANCLALASPRYEDLVIDAVIGDALVHVARPWAPTPLTGERGEIVTLLPVHGPALGVVTEGLLYPLRHENLPEGGTRGVSNEMDQTHAQVSLTGGTLLVVRPGTLGTHQITEEPRDP